MNFIKKVFNDETDELVHLQFQKFSRGEFKNKALVHARNSNGKYTIKTSAEFANELVRMVAGKIGGDKIKITGAIVSTSDLKEELKFKEIKQFQGVKRYLIDSEMSGEEIVQLLNRFPKTFFALSFDSGKGDVVKIKPKAPKSAKAKNKDEKPAPDFCRLVTNDEEIAKSFVFEKPNFKTAEISHNLIIEEIIIPDELKNEKDFSIIREGALRKGKIIRNAVIDGQDMKNEKGFVA